MRHPIRQSSLYAQLALLALVALLSLFVGACSDATTAPVDVAPYNLVYQSQSSATLTQSELYRLAGGSGARLPLFAAPVPGGQPSASADGRRIVFIGPGVGNDGGDIWLSVDGAAPTRIVTPPGIDYLPAISPDGRSVVYVQSDDGGFYTSLQLLNLETGVTRMLTELIPPTDQVVAFSRAAWSPDGSRIVFSRGVAGNLQLWLATITGAGAGGPPTRLSTSAVNDVDPSWSPRGDSIVFSRSSNPASSDLVIISVNSKLERLFDYAGRNQSPSWSPDGRIAWSSDKDDIGADAEIYSMRSDGSTMLRLTNDDVQDRRPVWVK